MRLIRLLACALRGHRGPFRGPVCLSCFRRGDVGHAYSYTVTLKPDLSESELRALWGDR